jgi:alpha-mannosidase
VFLETIKRGEYDDYSASHAGVTVILRLYEAYGGHAKVKLNIGENIPAASACVTNLLEDEMEELHLLRNVGGNGEPTSVTLDFHAFEVKTVKLTIGPAKASSVESCV